MVSDLNWHKSSYSPSGSNCVEVAEGARTFVRDSKRVDLGCLSFPADEWTAFLEGVCTSSL
ncbi:DUF397 domain-containing protein [Nocardiopsis rhodophaea]|uniref:DUF397 domain-containing protein n=1 Tax=Nocardiopsis rhodophaea TaxID=280238 RepID=UPI0031D408FC